MATRTLKYGSNMLVFILVVFAILAAISFLSSRRFVRADFSDDKRYTISQSTKNVLKRLDDVVTINAYFSRENPRRSPKFDGMSAMCSTSTVLYPTNSR